MTTLWQDIRYGSRMLWKSRGFTLIAVLALALGIGANTAIFSVVNTLLIRPLPFRESERIVMVWEHNKTRGNRQNVVNPANYLDWRTQGTVFEEIAAFYDARLNLTGGGDPLEVPTQAATPNLFTILSVEPIIGRKFTPEDALEGAPDVALISYGLWQSRFGGDPKIVDRQVSLNGTPTTIIGVLPADFQWFIKKGSLTDKPAQLWVPLGFTEQNSTRRGRYLTTVARLKPGVSVEQARAEMNAIGSRLEQQYPDSNKNWGVEVVPLREQFVGDIRPALWVLLGAVGFVLLIACANVANLLLARASARQKEIAIRTALGASRWRIIRQLLTESVLLSALSGALGLLLAWWGIGIIEALSPRDLVNLDKVSINLVVLGFTLIVSFVTGLIFGLAPAFEATRLNTNETLKEGGRSNIGGGSGSRLRSLFVVAEVALALVLLVSAGLLVKSFMRLQSVDPGFDADHLLTMRVVLPSRKYAEDHQPVAFFKQATERLRSLPGVKSASAVSFLPFAGLGAATSFTIEGRPAPAAGEKPSTDVCVIEPDYFRTMSIPFVSGRNFNEQETTEKRHVVIINQALARKYFGSEDPLGKRVTVSMGREPVPTEIIGVVGDVKNGSLNVDMRPMVYWPHPELAYTSMTIVMRTTGDPLALAAAAEREIRAIDPDQPVSDIRTMQQLLADSVARSRFTTTLLGLFAALALVLASVGIFGVMSYSVTQRTHEIGIRMALGATARDILRMILRQGLTLTLIGVAVGLIGAFALTRLMSSLLFGVSASDPITFTAVTLMLAGVALLACYIPARRATRVDPMVALRYE